MTRSGSPAAAPSSSEHLTSPKYRADIDGLRAIAVLSVIAFHALPGGILPRARGRGGYVGVDVFFVISGYLISTIIFENIDRKTFSFVDFYARRIRRIFPALLLVLVSTLAVGWFVLFPNDFRRLARHVVAGAGFVSNYVLLGESGYFDGVDESKPLLHLWSLAVEEQFYILWPAFLWFVSKRRINPAIPLLVVTLLSFLLNVVGIGRYPSATFYATPTRLWELSIGACVAHFALKSERFRTLRERNPTFLSCFGLFLIAVGVVFFHKYTEFPGWYALFPTLGAALLISVGPAAWMDRAVLSNPALVTTGLISFPLYLWHWPLLSFAIMLEGDAPSTSIRLAAAAASFPLAWLTYRLVERPIRFGRRGRMLSAIALGLMSVVAVFALVATRLTPWGFSPSQTELLSKIAKAHDMRDDLSMYGDRPCFKTQFRQTVDMFIENECVKITYPDRPVVFLIGDSHSASLSLGLKPLAERLGVNFLQVSTGWCEPTSNNKNDRTCRDINEMVLSRIESVKPEVLILDAHWVRASAPPYFLGGGDFTAALVEKLEELKRRGAKSILVVGEIPTWKRSLPDVLSREFVKKGVPIPTRTFEGVEADSLDMDLRMRAVSYPAGTTYLSSKDVLCDERGCLTAVGPDLETDVVVWDYWHLTPRGSAFLTHKLLEPALFSALGIR